MKIIEMPWQSKICCPFCNQLIVNLDDTDFDDTEISSDYELCEHTIFIATDEGFEFKSDKINKILNIDPEIEGFEIELPDGIEDINQLTDQFEIEGGIKIAVCDYNGLGAYFGFDSN